MRPDRSGGEIRTYELRAAVDGDDN
ncbi:MAG: hypothetical protein QOI99_1244, partial [Actinomycetota bacterium]|nr:hypothetical protein [Actinomycetota bacterium]